ncbi:MAG: hypothetical protein QOE75_1481 [Solirubrobacterales bacterium]|jgi:hypothetical protein|nr:hypothetical protein [Solirubrobacterales bacterium]
MKPSVYMQKHETTCFVITLLVTAVALFTGYFEVLALALYALLAIDWVARRLKARSGGARSTGSR